MNDLTSELQELANVDAHSASPVGSPCVPGVPNAFYPPLTGSGIELRVVRDGTPARRLRINATRCTFGSGEGCTVRLSDGSLQPLHAVLLREADRVLIRSCTAAIEVNGQPTSESLLNCGDVFRLGSYVFETLSLPQSSADDSAQDQAQRLRFMAAPDPELTATRQREQEMHQRLAEALQRCEQAQSQLEAANQVVAELQQQRDSLNQQVEALVAETQSQQADADAQALELRRLIDASEQAETRSRAAVDEALQQRDAALKERDHALRERDEAARQRDAMQQQLDLAVQQRDEALQQRDEAKQQREQAMARRSDAIDSEQAAQAKLRQLNQQILQLQQAQAAAESENLSKLSLEEYMSRLLQQMERAPATNPAASYDLPANATEPRPPLIQHQPQQQVAAEVTVLADDAADPLCDAPGDAAAALSPIAATPQQPTEQQPVRRAASSAAVPPPAPPRSSAWNNVLQVAVVSSCSLIFFYCGQRNPNLQMVWYTASALAAGLVLFAVYDLLAKSVRRSSTLAAAGQSTSRVGRP